MEISGIFGNGLGLDIPMTEEEKQKAEDIFSKYDPENMSKEDMEEMRSELREAGIRRSPELRDMMRDAGFGPGNPPQGAPMAQDSSGKGELWDVYQQFMNGDITEAEFLAQVRSGDLTGSLLDFVG